MGRYAGWIAACAGVASGAHAILIPEIPFTLEPVAATIAQREAARRQVLDRGRRRGGRARRAARCRCSARPIGQAEKLGGIGAIVAEGLERLTGKEARVVVLGHLLRGGTPDVVRPAARPPLRRCRRARLEEGDNGVMVALDPPNVRIRAALEAAIRMKTVPLDCDTILTARDIGHQLRRLDAAAELPAGACRNTLGRRSAPSRSLCAGAFTATRARRGPRLRQRRRCLRRLGRRAGQGDRSPHRGAPRDLPRGRPQPLRVSGTSNSPQAYSPATPTTSSPIPRSTSSWR